MGFTGARVELLDAADNIDLPGGTFVTVDFSSTSFDTDGYWDDAEPSTLVVPPTFGGVFEVGYSAVIVGNAAENNYAQAFILKNGSELILFSRTWIEGTVNGATIGGNALIQLDDTDTIQLQIVWSGVSTDSLLVDVFYSPALWLGRWT